MNDYIIPIKDYPGYLITRDGFIISSKRPYVRTSKVLKPFLTCGYLRVSLSKNGREKDRKVHQLMAETFIGPCPEGMEVCHNNGNALDNRLENLRYATHESNCGDTIRHSLSL
jgi:hypothetical protein